MSQATIIDGKSVAATLRGKVASRVEKLHEKHGLIPGLAVVLVGNDPASEVYVRNKGKQTRAVGMASFEHRLPETVSQDTLLALVNELNADDAVHGILVQLPLPRQIDEASVLAAIDPDKDVDGFHLMNVGRLWTGLDGLFPCTPVGCMILLEQVLGTNLAGKRAIILGRSNIVGKPMAQLLLRRNATITVAHSRTDALPEECRRADIVIAAVGRPEMVRGGWIKPGATVIDVGINRIDAPERGEGKTRLVGDVCFNEVVDIAGAITPVPGGVGPMTIACLLQNTVFAACRQAKLDIDD